MKEVMDNQLSDIPDPIDAGSPSPQETARAHRALSARIASNPIGSSLTRSQVVLRRRTALGAALAIASAQLLALGLRQDLALLPVWYLIGWLLLPMVLCGVAFGAGVHVGKYSLGVKVGLAATLAFAVPMAFMALAVCLPMPREVTRVVDPWAPLMTCIELTLIGALPLLVFGGIALRRSFVALAHYRGALLGAACGLLSGSVMNLHCPMPDPMHLVLGHALPVLIVTSLGALVGYRWLRP